jgi:hypothetical protein
MIRAKYNFNGSLLNEQNLDIISFLANVEAYKTDDQSKFLSNTNKFILLQEHFAMILSCSKPFLSFLFISIRIFYIRTIFHTSELIRFIQIIYMS